MKTHERIRVTKYTIEEAEDLYAFDAKHSELINETQVSETYEFGPYTRTYWFKGVEVVVNPNNASITHTQLQFDENWVEPESE